MSKHKKHRWRGRWAALGLLLVLSQALPSLVAAQFPVVFSEAAQAHAAYIQGIAALSALDYPRAVQHLERATQLAPTKTVYERMLRFARQKLQEDDAAAIERSEERRVGK